MSKSSIRPISRKSDLVTQESGNETLIYDLLIDKAYNLNETSSLIWNLCNGKNSVSDISAGLSKTFKTPISEDLVWLALEQLKKCNLLKNGEEIAIDFGDIPRRDVIRKIGFATLIALPLVSQIILPTAAQAASAACAGMCRCSNASASCNGSTATVGGTRFVNCLTTSGNNSNCNCVGPFNPDNSAGNGFKASMIGCTQTRSAILRAD